MPEDALYSYILLRTDIDMPPGKMASQAVHAGRLSLLHYLRNNPHRADEFIQLNSCGSVVALRTKNLSEIERAAREAAEAGLPWALFSDSGHILPPDFLGDPVVTALAIGPSERHLLRPITRRFRCV